MKPYLQVAAVLLVIAIAIIDAWHWVTAQRIERRKDELRFSCEERSPQALRTTSRFTSVLSIYPESRSRFARPEPMTASTSSERS